jgi:hypothetical protein
METIVDIFIKIYWGIGVIAIVVYLLIYYCEVLPTIKQLDHVGILSWLTNLKIKEEVERYKHICIQEGRSLYFYQLLHFIDKYSMSYFLCWVLTIFLWDYFFA